MNGGQLYSVIETFGKLGSRTGSSTTTNRTENI
ncbi:hypothetical protein JFL60_04450 [Histophilus somni]|nr:hypothetical protein JFL60_04450 [Histophilus somni]